MSNQKSGFQTAADLARFAKAAAGIAKAAAVAGPYGAAAAAAKSFAPQIIKFLVAFLGALAFLSYAVFAAIPNIMFGYEASSADDILQMNQLAAEASARYENIPAYTQEIIDEITNSLKSGYDDVKVNQEIVNTTKQWFIAISAVSANQDLAAMTEQYIKEFLKKTITYTTSTETYSTTTTTTDKNGNTVETETSQTRLIITFTDLDPETLMNTLGFDENEKNWASLMYSSLTIDSQYVPQNPSPGGGELPPSTGGDSYVFTDGQTDVVYYNQGDPRWGNKIYIANDNIRGYGCGPTSLAIVVSSFVQVIDPYQMAQWAAQNGYACPGSGSYRSLISGGAKHFGLTVESVSTRNVQKVADALADGKLVVCIMGPGHFTTGGHFIVLRGVTSDGKVLVADPASTTKSNQEWDISLVLGECRYLSGVEGPIWIIGKE